MFSHKVSIGLYNYKTTWCNTPEDHNLNSHHRENLKPYNSGDVLLVYLLVCSSLGNRLAVQSVSFSYSLPLHIPMFLPFDCYTFEQP
jgi:hypothetical protein